jgi:hypothetical protein
MRIERPVGLDPATAPTEAAPSAATPGPEAPASPAGPSDRLDAGSAPLAPKAPPASAPTLAALQPPGAASAPSRPAGDIPGARETFAVGSTAMTLVCEGRYNPHTTPARKSAADPELDKWLRASDPGGTTNYENTDFEKLAGKVVDYVNGKVVPRSELEGIFQAIADFFTWLSTGKKPNVLRDAGIRDPGQLKHLTPKQAMLLSRQIAMDILSYNKPAVEKGDDGQLTEQAKKVADPMDKAGVETFFAPDSKGVCRNYAEVVQAVFAVVKALQDPADKSQLNNTFAKFVRDYREEGTPHAWNAFFTVQADGSVLATQIDATWSDTDTPGTAGSGEYAFGANGARAHWLKELVFANAGHQGYDDLLKRFCPDRHAGMSLAGVAKGGGLDALRKALDALPETCRFDAAALMTNDLIKELARPCLQELVQPSMVTFFSGGKAADWDLPLSDKGRAWLTPKALSETIDQMPPYLADVIMRSGLDPDLKKALKEYRGELEKPMTFSRAGV